MPLKKIVRQRMQELQPKEIILFGSHAWGKPHRDSDLESWLSSRKVICLLPSERMDKAKRALVKAWLTNVA